jgi:hypothetical protein
MQLMRSDEIGLGPYTDNYWVLTVRDGKIVSTWQEIPFASNGFFEQMWEPFGAWVSIYHPDNVLTMYIDETKSMQRFTEESNRLWEQRIPEYIADVKQNPAAHLDQPKVAAYVAELDSIWGQRKPESRTRSKRSRSRINRQSTRRENVSWARPFSSCARSRCPRPFAGPTRDERSRSWRRCSINIRTGGSHRNRCPVRSSRSLALTSASFLSD